jgi:adenine-specific DNA-methyltransferase
MKTELIWEGKYDEYGNRREVDIAGCDMPLQKIESIDEPRSSAEGAGELALFEKQSTRRDDFRNMLIWGDNKLVMASLLRDFKGKIDLIYIDPPFDVGADFTMDVSLGEEADSVGKDQSILESVAYRDTWGRGTDSYLSMMCERLTLIRDLLSDEGKIAVHVGDKVSGAVRLEMNDVFGDMNYRNSIIIPRGIKNVQAQFRDVRGLAVGHDVLLLYAKSNAARLQKLSLPGTEAVPGKWDTFWRGTDRPTMRYELFGMTPSKGQWRWSRDRAFEAVANLEKFQTESQGQTLDEYYLNQLAQGNDLDFVRLGPDKSVQYYVPPRDYKLASTLWTTIRTRGAVTEYATEKNEELLSVIVGWLSQEDDLVADFFCGSGTTGAVAEKLGRRWIMCDLGRFAIHTTRKRMIEVQRQLFSEQKPYRAFDVYNLGRYERQWWQKERLKGADDEHRSIVLAFYRAEVLTRAPSPLLHGRKGPAFVHVDSIDSILTLDELKPVVEATAAAGAKEVHCLAWEFEMELKHNTEALEHEYKVKVRLFRIPREVMEKNRRPGVDSVPFFEMATLTAEPIIRIEGGERTVDVKLTSFLPSLSEVPSKELEALRERALRSGFDFIDFWAVDFDHRNGEPFKHHWQDYRLRKDRSLKTVSDCGFVYKDAKAHTICVKVIDTFGCDTSLTLEVVGAKTKK